MKLLRKIYRAYTEPYLTFLWTFTAVAIVLVWMEFA